MLLITVDWATVALTAPPPLLDNRSFSIGHSNIPPPTSPSSLQSKLMGGGWGVRWADRDAWEGCLGDGSIRTDGCFRATSPAAGQLFPSRHLASSIGGRRVAGCEDVVCGATDRCLWEQGRGAVKSRFSGSWKGSLGVH